MNVLVLGDGLLADRVRLLCAAFGHVPATDADCDLILLAGYARILPVAYFARARLGALCFHPSLLPRHRGRDAVYWTVKARETVTGVTWFWPDAGIDTGPVAAQAWCHIPAGVRPREVYERLLVPMGVEVLAGLLPRIARGGRPAEAQDEALASYEPPRERARLAAAAS